ncbi:uncharacterized protein LOC122082958 [Macadamia integrifolia]|uniref:uncharacterized protein LOC122082958 n=1 Tax=Macadamia integrifolia TaxID=60698 RepID=UPI001C500BDB|nr:uncharacterized protein LOC122082958 [Macadamia integrifolia]
MMSSVIFSLNGQSTLMGMLSYYNDLGHHLVKLVFHYCFSIEWYITSLLFQQNCLPQGFDENDGGTGSAEWSAEYEDTPYPGLLSSDGVSNSIEISESVDAGGYSVKLSESQHNIITQMPTSPEEESSAPIEHASDTQQVGVSETASANGNEIPVEDESSRGEGFMPETEQIKVVDKGSLVDQEYGRTSGEAKYLKGLGLQATSYEKICC